ncbi:hypothetical protein [Roseicyclus marinus]
MERQIMGPLARVPLGLVGLGLAGLVVLAAPEAWGNGGQAERPFSQGRDFADLDAYLAHLEALGPMDIQWYRRRPDGTYEQIRLRLPGTPPEIFTRQELLDRYGFVE